MKTQSTNKPWLFITGNLFIPTVIALTFLVFTFLYYPFREELEFDTDEGLNLMRSMLVVLHHPLYSEVSSDQPPLFTLLLALLLRVVGFKVAPARFLVLLFSTLLVWSCAQFLQLTWGKLSAILFLPLVMMTPRFMVLSVSVMIGVPSIALAALSMVLATLWHKQKNSLWLVLSGFTLAFSVLIKLFTGFVAVIFLVGITLSAYLENRENGLSWKMLQPALLWGLCFAGVTIVLGLALVGPQNVSQIIFPHVEAINKLALQDESYTINYHLRAAVPLLVLGFFGALLSIYTRNWLALYPLAWATLIYTLFSFYSPVYYHHQLLITVPFAMMAAAFVGEGFTALFRIRQTSDLVRAHTVMGIVALVGFGWVALTYLPKLDQQLMDRPRISGFSLHASAGRIEVIRAMNKYINQTNWILTDRPMYAFIVQRPVPPSLATFSKKRWFTGSLTEGEILAAMREYKPEQVLMTRFLIPGLEAYLHDKYTLIVSANNFRLFIRNDLLSPPK